MPTITWQNPADINYGTPLGSTQLNAMASVPGTFTYTPPAGTVLPAGQNQTLSVQFTPTDSADYYPAAASVSINVNKTDPQIEWDDIESIFYGQPLTTTQLDATANVPGTFDYNPGLGSILPTRTEYPLSVIFTPTDTADYNTVMATNKIDIFPAMPTITWSNPADIQLGTPLSATQLDATASFQGQPLAGTFSYSPPASTILGVGQNQTLQVTFTPSDSTDFVLATDSVQINVNPLTVVNTNDSGLGSLRQALLNAENLPGTTHTITFQIPSGPQTINLATALPAMTDPVVAVLDSTQNVVVNSPSGSGTNSFAMITKTGAGLLSLAGRNQLSGNLQVDGGRLRLADGAGSSPAAGISVTVDNAASLELAGTASNFTGGKTQPVNIANTSTTTARRGGVWPPSSRRPRVRDRQFDGRCRRGSHRQCHPARRTRDWRQFRPSRHADDRGLGCFGKSTCGRLRGRGGCCGRSVCAGDSVRRGNNRERGSQRDRVRFGLRIRQASERFGARRCGFCAISRSTVVAERGQTISTRRDRRVVALVTRLAAQRDERFRGYLRIDERSFIGSLDARGSG